MLKFCVYETMHKAEPQKVITLLESHGIKGEVRKMWISLSRRKTGACFDVLCDLPDVMRAERIIRQQYQALSLRGDIPRILWWLMLGAGMAVILGIIGWICIAQRI